MILFENVVGVSESSKDKDGKKFEPPVQAGLSNSLFYNTQNIVRSVAESLYCTVHLCIFKFAYIYIYNDEYTDSDPFKRTVYVSWSFIMFLSGKVQLEYGDQH